MVVDRTEARPVGLEQTRRAKPVAWLPTVTLMTELPEPFTRGRLDFHGPLSPERADRLLHRIAASRPSTVVDYGCGWGEFLLRVLDRCPDARGTGVDLDGPDIVRARAGASDRGLDGRVEFIEGPAADHTAAADLVINVGAYHAFGTVPEALAALFPRVNPGGRLLFGAEIWAWPPTPTELANMWDGITADACYDLATLADLAVAAGFRLLRAETSTVDEWDEFEFGMTIGQEEALLAEPDAARAGILDSQHNRYLRGSRGVMSFAYLTLGRPLA
jgi:trans-aconitate methyltransferase